MGGLWWMVFGWAAGHVVDAWMAFGPPDGALGGGGGGGIDSPQAPCHACVVHR